MNNILVVDDDQTVLKVIKSQLELHDMQVFTVMNPKSAVAKMNAEVIDLTLVDLVLNGNSGLDLMETLHGIAPEMPIIIITGYGTIQTAVEAKKRGASTNLTKPFDLDELLLQIKNCMEKPIQSKAPEKLTNRASKNMALTTSSGKARQSKTS